MTKRSVSVGDLAVVVLALLVTLGAPSAALRVLPVFEEESSETREEGETSDLPVLCASHARRTKMRDGAAEPSVRDRCSPIVDRRHGRCSSFISTPCLDVWFAPLRC